MAEPQTIDRLKALAKQRGVSFGAVVREALDEKSREYRPPLTCIGTGRSGRSDISTTEATEPIGRPLSWR